MKFKKHWAGFYQLELGKRIHISFGSGDAWGFAIEVYPSDPSIIINIIKFYISIAYYKTNNDTDI